MLCSRFIAAVITILSFYGTVTKVAAQVAVHAVTQVTADENRVDSVGYEGLKKSKASYLNKFAEIDVGTSYTAEELQAAAQRVQNLDAIAAATYRFDDDNSSLLIFEVTEAWTLFPIVNLGGVKENFWFQLGFTDANFLGRGMQLTAFYQNTDRRHNFTTYFRAPYIGGSNFGFSLSALRYASVEPLYFGEDAVFYRYTNSAASGSLIYNTRSIGTFELGGSYFLEDYEKDVRHLNEMTPGPEGLKQPKALGKLMHLYNGINYHFYLLSGFHNTANFQTVYNFDDLSLFHIFLNDTRYFSRVGLEGNFAARLRLGLSTNNDTPFAPFVLDSQVNIRGSGNRIDRGTAAAVLNVEYRHAVYDRKKLAAQVVGFSDLGTWREPGGPFSDLTSSDNFRHFIGLGGRLIYKEAFNAILRVDYGVDVYNTENRGFVLGIGQYF